MNHGALEAWHTKIFPCSFFMPPRTNLPVIAYKRLSVDFQRNRHWDPGILCWNSNSWLDATPSVKSRLGTIWHSSWIDSHFTSQSNVQTWTNHTIGREESKMATWEIGSDKEITTVLKRVFFTEKQVVNSCSHPSVRNGNKMELSVLPNIPPVHGLRVREDWMKDAQKLKLWPWL